MSGSWSPPVGGTDPRIANFVPSDIEIRSSHFDKRPSWQTTNAWKIKKSFGLKNVLFVLADGNAFENDLLGEQNGTAILFTPRDHNGTTSWSELQDVRFENNSIRSTEQGFLISGDDNLQVSQQTKSI